MPPVAAAPQAAAPATTPVAVPPAAKPDLKQLPTERPQEDWMGEIGTELEALDENNKPPRPAPKDTRKPKGPAEPTPEEEQATLEELEDDTRGTERHLEKDKTGQETEQTEQPGAQKDPQEPDPAKMGARDLRKAYETSKKQIREEYQPKIAKLEARVKELEAAPQSPKEDPDREARYKSIEARNKELEEEMRFVDYQKSNDYQENYWKPYLKAWADCKNDIKDLTVEVRDPNNPSEYINRPATDEDIMSIANSPRIEWKKKCNALFGDYGDEVYEHVKEIRRLSERQQEALSKAKKDSGERAAKQQAESLEQARVRNSQWEIANKDLTTKFPKWFAPVEGDAQGNAHLAAGQSLANFVFKPRALTQEDVARLPKVFRDEIQATGKLSEQSRVRIDAIVYNRAASQPRIVAQNQALRKELATLKKKLEQFEASEPPIGGASPGRGRAGEYVDDANAEIDQLDRQGR